MVSLHSGEVKHGVPQKSVLELVLASIVISDQEYWVNSEVETFADDTELLK